MMKGNFTIRAPTTVKGFQESEETFPFRLFDALEKASELHSESVSWVEAGTRFMIHDRDLFMVEVMPHHFSGQSQFKSFQRQLNLYGFFMTKKGPLKGSFYHPNFIKGRRELCHLIIRPSRLLNPTAFCNSKKKKLCEKKNLQASCIGKEDYPSNPNGERFQPRQQSIISRSADLKKLDPNQYSSVFNKLGRDKIEADSDQRDRRSSKSINVEPVDVDCLVTKTIFHPPEIAASLAEYDSLLNEQEAPKYVKVAPSDPPSLSPSPVVIGVSTSSEASFLPPPSNHFRHTTSSISWMADHSKLLEEFASELVVTTFDHPQHHQGNEYITKIVEHMRPDVQSSSSVSLPFAASTQFSAKENALLERRKSELTKIGVEEEIISTFNVKKKSFFVADIP